MADTEETAMILFRAMDYDKRELLTIKVFARLPSPGSIIVYDKLDQELNDVDQVILRCDNRTETYEADIVIKGKTRTATIVGIDIN
jgi:hypothetical protein